jgi:hypothetical protein
MWYVLHLVCEINLDTRYRGKSMWAGPTRKIGKSMWAGPTREKKKRTYYILCQSYPQALKLIKIIVDIIGWLCIIDLY